MPVIFQEMFHIVPEFETSLFQEDLELLRESGKVIDLPFFLRNHYDRLYPANRDDRTPCERSIEPAHERFFPTTP